MVTNMKYSHLSEQPSLSPNWSYLHCEEEGSPVLISYSPDKIVISNYSSFSSARPGTAGTSQIVARDWRGSGATNAVQ